MNLAELRAINDLDVAFGTTKFLPAFDTLEPKFQNGTALGCHIASAIFGRLPLPGYEVEIRPEFEGVTIREIERMVHAHITSYEPKHEHKIAGVGWLIEQVLDVEMPSAVSCTDGPDSAYDVWRDSQ